MNCSHYLEATGSFDNLLPSLWCDLYGPVFTSRRVRSGNDCDCKFILWRAENGMFHFYLIKFWRELCIFKSFLWKYHISNHKSHWSFLYFHWFCFDSNPVSQFGEKIDQLLWRKLKLTDGRISSSRNLCGNHKMGILFISLNRLKNQ